MKMLEKRINYFLNTIIAAGIVGLGYHTAHKVSETAPQAVQTVHKEGLEGKIDEQAQEPPFNPIYSIQIPYDFNNLSDPKASDFGNDNDLTLLARLIFGEARGEPREVKTAIAYTVLNRAGKGKWWGNTIREVILKPKQYTCFNPNDPNYKKILDPWAYEERKVWKECLEVAYDVLTRRVDDPTNGATHYVTKDPRNVSWARGQIPVLVMARPRGSTVWFYRLKR